MKGLLHWLRAAGSSLEIEDVLLFLINLVVLPWLGHDALRSRLRELPPGLFALGLAFLGYGGFFICVATHVQPVDADGTPRPGRGRLWLFAAYLGQIFGYPMLAYLLADRDNGEVFALILIALLTAIAYALSFRRGARTLSVKMRRFLLLPLTLFTTWYATEHLVGKYVFDPIDLDAYALAIDSGSLLGMMRGFAVFCGRTIMLMTLPYIVLVIAPRFVAGELAHPRVWLQRFALFVLGAAAGLSLDAYRAASGSRSMSAPLTASRSADSSDSHSPYIEREVTIQDRNQIAATALPVAMLRPACAASSSSLRPCHCL
jgi:hypothetical protein